MSSTFDWIPAVTKKEVMVNRHLDSVSPKTAYDKGRQCTHLHLNTTPILFVNTLHGKSGTAVFWVSSSHSSLSAPVFFYHVQTRKQLAVYLVCSHTLRRLNKQSGAEHFSNSTRFAIIHTNPKRREIIVSFSHRTDSDNKCFCGE